MAARKGGKTTTSDVPKIKVVKPTMQQKTRAALEKSKTFARLIREKDVLLRSELKKAAEDRGLWDDKKQEKLDEVRKKILDGDAQLSRGGRTLDGKPFSRAQAKQLALDMMDWRSEFLDLNSVLTEFDGFTCETQSEQAEFDSLCASCILNGDDTPMFADINAYRAGSNDPEVEKKAGELSTLINEYDPSWYNKLPEISFLMKYKFINDEHRLIDEDGQLVNGAGQKVDKDGQLINEQGELINDYGEKVDKDGKSLEFVEFVD
jgi:hypothetical protein